MNHAVTADRFALLRAEFPDYDVATLPSPIPAHWAETSWHNDTCPSFEVDDGLRIWVDYADPAQSEYGTDRSARFSVIDYRGIDHSEGADLYGGDDWNAVLWAVALHEPIADRPAAERFIEALHAASLSYHFDDGAVDCLHRNGLLSLEDAERVDRQIAACYAAWEASGADLRTDCPIGYSLRLMERDAVAQAAYNGICLAAENGQLMSYAAGGVSAPVGGSFTINLDDGTRILVRVERA